MVDRLTFKECCCLDFQNAVCCRPLCCSSLPRRTGRATTWPECTGTLEVVVFGTDAAVGRFSVSCDRIRRWGFVVSGGDGVLVVQETLVQCQSIIIDM